MFEIQGVHCHTAIIEADVDHGIVGRVSYRLYFVP